MGNRIFVGIDGNTRTSDMMHSSKNQCGFIVVAHLIEDCALLSIIACTHKERVSFVGASSFVICVAPWRLIRALIAT
jgi:hypothetical protein